MALIPSAGDVVAGAAGGLAQDEAKGGVRRVAASAADAVHPGDLDNRDGTLATPAAQELYSGFNARLRELVMLDEQQASIVELLLREQRAALQSLVAAIAASEPQTRAEVFHFQGTDRVTRVQTPNMDSPGVWNIETITAWAACDNAVPVSLLVAIEGVLPIPFELVAPNNGVVTVSLGLPLMDASELQIGPMAGGVAADRATAIVKYKLN